MATAKITVVASFLEAHRNRSASQISQNSASNILVHGPGWEIIGLDHYLESQNRLWKEVPNQQLVAEKVIATEDEVVVEWLDRAEHPATDGQTRDVITSGCSIFRFEGEKISDVAVYADGVDILRQLSNR